MGVWYAFVLVAMLALLGIQVGPMVVSLLPVVLIGLALFAGKYVVQVLRGFFS